MRLNQLAKKVGKPYTRIEKYLSKDLKFEEIDGPNTKIPNELVEAVIQKFGLAEKAKPSEVAKPKYETIEAKPIDFEIEAIIEEPSITVEESNNEVEEVVAESKIIEKEEKIDPIEVQEVEEKVVSEEDNIQQLEEVQAVAPKETIVEAPKQNIQIIETEETVLHVDEQGVIVAPKVTLGGPKVVGKIDLPQPKVAEVVEEQTDEKDTEENKKEEIAIPKKKTEQSKPRKQFGKQRVTINQLTRAEKDKILEAKEAEQRAKIEEKKKEARRKAYEQQVKKSVNKVSKTKKAKVESTDAPVKKVVKKEEELNLSTWKKIVKWFNT